MLVEVFYVQVAAEFALVGKRSDILREKIERPRVSGNSHAARFDPDSDLFRVLLELAFTGIGIIRRGVGGGHNKAETAGVAAQERGELCEIRSRSAKLDLLGAQGKTDAHVKNHPAEWTLEQWECEDRPADLSRSFSR